jgi:signal transduction histidine kinase/CheY-like chemotaxis protein
MAELAQDDVPELFGENSTQVGTPASRRSKFVHWAWLPVPVLLAAMVALWAADLRQTYIAPGLTLGLQLLFVTLASVLVGYLASRSFLSSGSLAPVLLVCGILLWGFAGVAARTAGGANFNGSVTIHNLLTWLAAFCHLLGAAMGETATVPARRRAGWLLASYGAIALALLLVVRAALEGWTPLFFVQGEGGTAVRQIVLASAIAMLAVSAALLVLKKRAGDSTFASWYAIGLALAAAGLFGVLISTVHSGALNWAGVLTQCLSGPCFVAAAFAAFREAGGKQVSLAAAPSEPGLRYALAVIFVAAALALRMLFNDALGARTLYVTFFPAVILTALYGGRGPGFLAVALSALCLDYFLLEPLGALRIHSGSDMVAVLLFALCAALLVWITALMQQSLARAAAAEADLRLAAERRRVLQEADRAKDEFLAMLSHELRNPLAALTSAAHVLRVAEPAGAASAQARGIIERQTAHMAHLIEDLLDISRVTMGKLVLERHAFDLAEAVAGVVQLWRSAGRLDRHQLELGANPVWVHADRSRVEQIVSNLVDNAVKFTPAGKRISVHAAQEGDWAVLRVSDSGRGLAPDALERIFEPFVQGEQSLHRGEGGLGIGLALVKRLATLHGGSVSAGSAGPGRGAEFVVRLPASAAPATLSAASAPASRSPARRRVLLIEDNEDARDMLRAALAMRGHEVRAAATGAAGIAAAADAWPEVALVDIGLPDIDGYELARHLRRDGLRLIAITGYGQPRDEARSRAAGFDAHLVKPVNPERLDEAMARA